MAMSRVSGCHANVGFCSESNASVVHVVKSGDALYYFQQRGVQHIWMVVEQRLWMVVEQRLAVLAAGAEYASIYTFSLSLSERRIDIK